MIGLWITSLALGFECAELSLPGGDRSTPSPGLPTGPVHAALLDGGLGRARRACPRTELAVAPRALLLVDTPNFYGHVVAGLSLDGALALDPDTELFGRLELIRYDSVISAVTSSTLTPGHTTVGATRVLRSEGLILALTGELVLPTALGLYRGAWPLGLDVGLASQWADGPVEIHGQLTALGSAALSRGPALPRAGLAPVLGGSVRPLRGLALALDLQSMFLYTDDVDVVALAPAVRLGLGDAWGAEIGSTLPLAGRERALAVVDLRVAWRPGERP
ncbi:MAG TPA: hypothetical protein ENK18_18950 [Deltaproteobacteria bacterium]|nr:hypothetical protein [Deltaproteobacteria bacterium]